MTEPKKWVVRSWDPGASEYQAVRLESVLNELADTHYRVHKLDLRRRLVTAYYAGPQIASPLLTALFGGRPAPTSGVSGTPMREDTAASLPEEECESEVDYDPKGKLTPYLIDQLTHVMDAHSRGDTHVRDRVHTVVKSLFGKAPRHEVECSLNDMQAYYRLHLKPRASGGRCSGTNNCSTHAVLEAVKVVLEEHLSSKPTS